MDIFHWPHKVQGKEGCATNNYWCIMCFWYLLKLKPLPLLFNSTNREKRMNKLTFWWIWVNISTRKGSLIQPLLHLSFGYHEQRLHEQGNACKKAIYCRCACALHVWVNMFFHTALWLELLCVESVHAAATGTCMETWSLTRQALNTYAWTCITLSSLGLLTDTVLFCHPEHHYGLTAPVISLTAWLWTVCMTYYQHCTMLINLSSAAPFSWGKVINVQIVLILFSLVLII